MAFINEHWDTQSPKEDIEIVLRWIRSDVDIWNILIQSLEYHHIIHFWTSLSEIIQNLVHSVFLQDHNLVILSLVLYSFRIFSFSMSYKNKESLVKIHIFPVFW